MGCNGSKCVCEFEPISEECYVSLIFIYLQVWIGKCGPPLDGVFFRLGRSSWEYRPITWTSPSFIFQVSISHS